MRARFGAWLRAGRAGRLLFCALFVVALALDQLTKAWAVANLPVQQPVDVFAWLAPVLSFTFVRNTGVAFGLFPQLGDLFTMLSALIVVAIILFRRTLPPDASLIHGALGLVTGGAMGNLVDRWVRGYVVDFLDVNFWPLASWPVFNLADAAIVLGVIVLFVDSVITERDLMAADV